jgi:hypothetical protein
VKGWADSATGQEDQFAQLGHWWAAGWCDEHHRLISKEGSLVLPSGQVSLKSADLWGRQESHTGIDHLIYGEQVNLCCSLPFLRKE